MNEKSTLCPLCNSTKYFLLKEYKVTELIKKWDNNFSYNPFNDNSDFDTISKLQCANCSLIYYNPVIMGDGKLYEHLSSSFDWYYEDNKWEYDYAIQAIQKHKPSHLLEIGCGKGAFLSKVSNALETTGIEYNSNAVKTCINNNLNVIQGGLETLSIQFDIICTFQVLEHIHDIGDLLNNIKKSLVKDGLLIISVPNPDSILFKIDDNLLDLPPHHALGINKEAFENIAGLYDMEIIDYALEPLRKIHFEGFYESLLDNSKARNFLTRKLNCFTRKFNNELIQRSLIDTYLNTRNSIAGHTHLVVLKNK